MRMPKRNFPKTAFKKSTILTEATKRFPFFLKEYGYCRDKKFQTKTEHSYSDILILYTCKGTARYLKQKTSSKLLAHQVVITSCHAPLQMVATTSEWTFFYIIISGSHSKLFYNLIRTKNDILTVNPLVPLLDYFIDLVQLNCVDKESADVNACLLIHSILNELYLCTVDISYAKRHTPVQESDLNTALKYIANHYQEDLSLDTICAEVNLSKYYFCKIFTAHMGISVHRYLNEYRINKSKSLLSYSTLSIASVAREVGFKNPLSYIRCFKNMTQMTPTEYRTFY